MNKNLYYRPQFHLAPPAGWLNDPNGLCELNGIHHIFFQYSPDFPNGGDKFWGHYETEDFIHYTFTGIFLKPDTPEDRSGVYSGSSYIEDRPMYIYYTGNVKIPGDYDYIHDGREANTILVTSRDGITATEKECLLKTANYPEILSRHVRDPKVFSQDGVYYMVLGARTKKDEGCVLLYTSSDKRTWKFSHFIKKNDFGYMWECPDLFCLGEKQFLSVSPQGLEAEEYRCQNIYQSGYFTTSENILDKENGLEEFTEWDYGFDFYAAQTYEDETGRRILIGWMGVPDAEYSDEPTIREGWQHMLTLPRELTLNEADGKILQNPIKEIENLRDRTLYSSRSTDGIRDRILPVDKNYELLLSEIPEADFELTFDENLHFSYEKKNRTVSLRFDDNTSGYGRTARKIRLSEGEKITDIRAFIDSCCIEIFLNHGAYVFTSKYFRKKDRQNVLKISGSFCSMKIYSLKAFEIQYNGAAK